MFQARIAQLGDFRKLIDIVKDMIPDANLEVSEAGICLMSTDPLNILQVTINLPAIFFEDYECHEAFKMNLSLPGLSQLLKLAESEDSLIFSSAPDLTVLNLCFQAHSRPKVCEFTLNLNANIMEDVDPPELPYQTTFYINAREFHGICGDLIHLSEFLIIDVNKARVKFSIKCSAAGGSISYKQRIGQNGTLIRTFRSCRTELNLAYLKKITKAHVLSKNTEIVIHPDEPVLLKYAFGDAEIKFYLAPGISDNE
ncbi:unnamed protein product [Blepharisma stoltei]|uniref:DNA sliding clamp PCNA n=1 Tax=Blepharisma stoltei TaxID=1481888 RepID=A0AAU9IKC0_9CILI|nr:unnamed protein product [Blepharisma stoltei]